MPCQAMPRHAMPCHAMSSMPCHAAPCHAMSSHAVPCRALPCRAMPCRAMPRRAVPSRAVPCHTTTHSVGRGRLGAISLTGPYTAIQLQCSNPGNEGLRTHVIKSYIENQYNTIQYHTIIEALVMHYTALRLARKSCSKALTRPGFDKAAHYYTTAMLNSMERSPTKPVLYTYNPI